MTELDYNEVKVDFGLTMVAPSIAIRAQENAFGNLELIFYLTLHKLNFEKLSSTNLAPGVHELALFHCQAFLLSEHPAQQHWSKDHFELCQEN